MEPAGEVEVAGLVVEGEESHVDLARGAELGGRRPEHVARVVDLGEAAHVLRREVVGAETIQLWFVCLSSEAGLIRLSLFDENI